MQWGIHVSACVLIYRQFKQVEPVFLEFELLFLGEARCPEVGREILVQFMGHVLDFFMPDRQRGRGQGRCDGSSGNTGSGAGSGGSGGSGRNSRRRVTMLVEAICAGRAASLPDGKRSAIAKSPLEGPVEIGLRGVAARFALKGELYHPQGIDGSANQPQCGTGGDPRAGDRGSARLPDRGFSPARAGSAGTSGIGSSSSFWSRLPSISGSRLI